MATEVDVPHLSNYLAFPAPSLDALLSGPTIDIVRSLLVQVAHKAQEHEQVQSEKLKLEVELENAVRAGEQKARVLRASVDRGLTETASLRQQLQSEASSNGNLERELESIKSSTSSADSEVATLKSRINSLESSNRDTLSLLQSKSSGYDDLASELTAKHQKTIELRGELAKSEHALQEIKNASTSAKFREQGVQQEIEALRRNNEWLDSELKTKSAEYSKYRKEKGALLSELQRQNEDAATSTESMQRMEQTLRARLEEIGQKSEEYLARIQELRDEADRNEETFRAELDTANRLADLMKESCSTERQRHQDLSAQLEQAKDDAAEELGRINAEIETEHQDRLAAEARIAELEVQIERLEADVSLRESTAKQLDSRSNASRRGTPGPDGTPSRMMSPMGSSMRGGISYTQVISDYHMAKTELDAEKRRNEKLSSTIDEMIHDMEARQPEIVELQTDHARLEADVVDMSNLVDKIGKERDQAKKDAKKWEREVHGLTREGELLRQQLRDLSSQIKVLLIEFHAQGQGLDSFTPEQRSKLEQLVIGNGGSEASQEGTATDIYISQNLATFRSIAELADQNTKLLRLTRELGDRMEGEEAQLQKSQASQAQEELQDLRQKYERCRDEITSLVTQSQSYIRERDMFRRMLSHRGQLPPGSDLASMFGDSVNGQPPATPTRNGVLTSVEQSPSSKDMQDYAKLLKEMQTHFDSYRQEASADRSMLKEQLDGLSKKSSDLRNDLSKKNGEVTLLTERYEMLQGNFTMLKSENAELQKRYLSSSERAAKQDMRAQQIAEDLVEAKGFLESMRNESANLKAEKDFWRVVEKRLVEDNAGLLADRDRLNTLNSNLQQLLNDREHSDADGRRRLQLQVENLDNELQSAKRKVIEEAEEHKRVSMRREYENSQSQTRIDDLMRNLGSVREELIAAKTTRDHLQAKCDELTIELRSAEERLDVLQQRPDVDQPATSPSGKTAQEESVSREQELSLEVSELKRDLDLANGELANVRTQVEQYKAISQSSEEELRSFNETQDQYRQEMDKIIEEKDKNINSLEQNMEKLRENLSSISSELEALRTDSSQHGQKLEEQKATYEAEVARLKDLNERSETASKFHQEDLKAQAEIAQQAQQNYENELVKHAEAAKLVQKVRADYNILKLQVMELQSTAEASQAKLTQNEESWSEAKDRYERELAEIRSRRDDIVAQNRVLHQQLESVNKQVAELQRHRATTLEDGEESNAQMNTDTENLQELIRYLRREKEIVDVQFDLSTQEARRLRQQLDHTQTHLEETRVKLVQQRRAEENSERHALSHKKLLDTIEELNLNRESNSTLRLEKKETQAALNEKLERIEALQNQFHPLQARVSELEGTNEGVEQDLRLAQEARARFEQRYLDLLNRSDSIDPAEFENLKQQIADLEIERDALSQSKTDLQTEVDSIPDKIKESVDDANKGFQEVRQKIIDQSKRRDRDQTTKIRDKDTALQIATQVKEGLEQQIASIREELENTKVEHAATIEKVQAEAQAHNQAKSQSRMDIDQAPDSRATAGKEGSEDGQIEDESSRLESAETKNLQQKLDETGAKLATAEARIAELESLLSVTQRNLEQAQSTIITLRNQLQDPRPTSQNGPAETEEVESLRQELDQARQEAEEYRSTALIQENASKIEAAGELSIADQITARVDEIRVELTARHEERTRQAEELHKKNTERMKVALNKRLADSKNDITQKLELGHREAIERMKAEHEQKIETLNQRHKDELDELRIMTSKPNPDTKVLNADQAASLARNDASIQTLDLISRLSDAEVRTLLQKNELARKLVTNSLTNRENKVKEEQQRVLLERLAEAEIKANAAREQAVIMEGKKLSVKMSMTENRARVAGARLEVVQKAATETPEKPVGEVWAIAKDTKPAAPAAASSTPRAAGQNQTPAPAATSSQNPTLPTQTQHAPAANPFAAAAPNGTVIAASFGHPSNLQAPIAGQAIAEPSFAQPAHASSSSRPPTHPSTAVAPAKGAALQGSSPSNAARPVAAQAPQIATLARPLAASAHAPLQRHPSLSSSSILPVPSAGRGIQGGGSSGIPRGGGGAAGANISRGRGGGIGRGGAPSGIGRGGPHPPAVNTAVAMPNAQQQQQSGSPRTAGGAGPSSAQAKQFVPKKRSAEETGLEGSAYAGGDGKRARGGGGGSIGRGGSAGARGGSEAGAN